MSYIKCYQGQKLDTNYFEMHLWEDDGKHQIIPYKNSAYVTCPEGKHTHRGLNGEYLKSTTDWYFSKNPKYADKSTRGLHFHDMPPYQKFLIDRYGINDEPSKNHKEIFFDIEIEMGGALTEEYIQSAPKPVTSIAWWYKQKDEWVILILDEKKQLKHTKAKIKRLFLLIPKRNY